MNKDKALVKETGEIKDIETQYTISTIKVKLKFDIADNEVSTTFTKDSNIGKEGTYYVLSDNEAYHEDNLIVGQDNIREEKLKKLI
jgi:hypothetical protein